MKTAIRWKENILSYACEGISENVGKKVRSRRNAEHDSRNEKHNEQVGKGVAEMGTPTEMFYWTV